MPSNDCILMAFIRFIYLLLIFYCCINERKEVAAIPSLLVFCVLSDWSVASSCHSVGNLCPDWRSWLQLQFQLQPRPKRERKEEKKGTDIAASAQQSCRSIHQKMETNFLSVVVSPVDVIVVLAAVAHNTLRLLLLFHFFLFSLFTISVLLLLHFLLGFLLIFCCLPLAAIQWSENGAACT